MKLQRLILLLIVQVGLLAYGAEPKQTSITCKVYNGTGSGIFLYKIQNGEAVSLGFRRPVAGLDTCVFSIPLQKEAIFFLRKATLHSSEFENAIYLKPGENKWVDYYFDRIGISDSSVAVRQPNKETIYLQNWVRKFTAVYKLGVRRTERNEFTSAFDKLETDASTIKAKAVSTNTYFKKIFSAKVGADIQFIKAAGFFYNTERMNGDYDTASDRKHLYESLTQQKFCDAGILQSEHGMQLVKFAYGYRLFQQVGTREQMQLQLMNGTSFTANAKSICNDAVRAAYVFSHMLQISNYETFKREIQPFRNLMLSPEYKAAYQKKEDELTVYAKGAVAYNFSLTDTRDRTVSLSDFRGKVVVLDVWAMWCAPCLNEKPFFQKTEKEYKDRNDIVFVSISHDGLSKKDPWKNFIERKGWEGIELLANYNESIGKYYKIEGIPRFMIFDKEGKIVTVDAPRPSDPAFKRLIEQTLKDNARATNP